MVRLRRKCNVSDQISKAALTEFTYQLCSVSFKALLGMLVPKVKVTEHSKIPILVMAADQHKIFSNSNNEKTAKQCHAVLRVMKDIAHDIDVGC